MRDQTDYHLVEAVIEQEAGDFLRAAGCHGMHFRQKEPHLPREAIPPVTVVIFQGFDGINDRYNCCLKTKRMGNDFMFTFKYDGGFRNKNRFDDRREGIVQLSIEAIRELCTMIVEVSEGIEESTLKLLPLYQGAYEELRHCPEKAAEWLLEKGIHYHAAKNFLQGEKDDHRTDDFSTRFYCDHA